MHDRSFFLCTPSSLLHLTGIQYMTISENQDLKNRKMTFCFFLKDCNYGNRIQTTERSAKHFYKRNCKDMSKRRDPSLTGNLFKDTWVLYYLFMYPLISLETCDNLGKDASTCKGYQRSCCLEAMYQAGKVQFSLQSSSTIYSLHFSWVKKFQCSRLRKRGQLLPKRIH